MKRFELGQLWLARLGQRLPETSIRLRTKLAWHLAALSVQSDEDLKKLSDDQLAAYSSGSIKLIELRVMYLRAAERTHSPIMQKGQGLGTR